MNTAFQERDSSIGLQARTRYNDGDSSFGDSHPSTSNLLLGVDSETGSPVSREQSLWDQLPRCGVLDRQQRKPSVRTGDHSVDLFNFERRKGSRKCLNFGIGFLAVLGVVQLLNLVGNVAVHLLPDRIHRILGSWGRPGQIGSGLASWPTDFSRDILPISCHSHNDYWRSVPLFSAIEAGCIGVEADVWLFEEELFVGHSISSLTPNRTLNSLYINPLLDILSKQNPKHTLLPNPDVSLHGVFDTTPEQTLIFLIDFKSSGSALWPHVLAALHPLRSQGYLTHLNGTELVPGPVTVVGTGNAPFDLIASDVHNSNHDVFFDAPLENLYESPNDGHSSDTRGLEEQQADEGGQDKTGTPEDPAVYTSKNSYYASVAFSQAIGHLRNGNFSVDQMSTLRRQIKAAHMRGLKARYWDLPFWPISLRNHVWDVLVKEGVDLLNVDDLSGATKRNWAIHRGWWRRMKRASYGVHDGVS